MKTCFLLLLTNILFTVTSLNAQEPRLADPDADKFIGMWEYISDNELFRIVFRKDSVAWGNAHMEILRGNYLVELGANRYDSKDIISPMVCLTELDNANTLGGSFVDDVYLKQLSFRLELLPGKTDEARWVVKYAVPNSGKIIFVDPTKMSQQQVPKKRQAKPNEERPYLPPSECIMKKVQ